MPHGFISVLDSSGHTDIVWDHGNQDEINMARETFDAYRKKNFTMMEIDEDNESLSKASAFNPQAFGYRAIPQMRGG